MSATSDDRWTCPSCEVTEHRPPGYTAAAWRAAVQHGHAERHEAERGTAGTVAEALLEATEQIVEFRVRLVVHPAELERVRTMIVRRSLPIEVFADSAVDIGEAYVMRPRRGVREVRP